MLTRVRVVTLGDCLENSALICQFEKKNRVSEKEWSMSKGSTSNCLYKGANFQVLADML
jgi:hypothetical protein